MNDEVLRRLYPEIFRRRAVSGVVLYVLLGLLGLLSIVVLVSAFSAALPLRIYFGAPWKNVLVSLVLFSVSYMLILGGRAFLQPCKHSLAALRLIDAKRLLDTGALDVDRSPNLDNVTVEYAGSSMLSLIEVYEKIDRQNCPDNFRVLQMAMRESALALVKEGLFDDPRGKQRAIG